VDDEKRNANAATAPTPATITMIEISVCNLRFAKSERTPGYLADSCVEQTGKIHREEAD